MSNVKQSLTLILPVIVWICNYYFNFYINRKVNSKYLDAKQADDSRLEELKDQYRMKYGIRYGTDISITEVVTALYIQDTVREKRRIVSMTLTLVLQFVIYLCCMYGFYFFSGIRQDQIEWEITGFHREMGIQSYRRPDEYFFRDFYIGMFLCFAPLVLIYMINVYIIILVQRLDGVKKERNCNLTSESYFLIDEFISINQEDEDKINNFMQTLKERKLSTVYQYAQKELNVLKN